MASFPTSTRSYTNKTDITDTIYADHINALQEEVVAIETFMAGTVTSSYTGSFAATITWTTLNDRLQNIEKGLANGVPASPYLLKTGGTINPTAAVGLLIQPISGSSNIFEARTSAAVLGFNVNSSGIPKVGTNNVLYVTSSEYVTVSGNATTALANSAIADGKAVAAQATADAAYALGTAGLDLKLSLAYGFLLGGL